MGYFAVQAFARSGRGALVEEAPISCKTKDEAVRIALRISAKKAGAVAFFRSSNDFDEYADPEFLAAHGSIPEHILDSLPEELTPIVSSQDAVTDGPIDNIDLKLRGWRELL